LNTGLEGAALMRTFAVAVLGLVAGLILGLAVNEVISAIALPDQGNLVGSAQLPVALLLGFGPFLFAVGGAIAGPLVDRRARRA
jgi:hypothetical protein